MPAYLSLLITSFLSNYKQIDNLSLKYLDAVFNEITRVMQNLSHIIT